MKRFLYANDGFFSVYAMLLLSIAMLFSTFLFCKIHTAYTMTKLSYSDIFVLYKVNSYLKHQPEEVPDEMMNEENEKSLEDSNITEEELFYNDAYISITYDDQEAVCKVKEKHQSYVMYITYNKQEKKILAYRYEQM